MMIRLLWLLVALALALPAAADEPLQEENATASSEGVDPAPAGGIAPGETSAGSSPSSSATAARPAPHPSAVLRSAKASEEHGLRQRVAAMVAEARPYWLPVLGAVGALVVVGSLLFWRRQVAVYRLPEFAVQPRLGGSHGAGIGGVISFADPSQPPSSQDRLRPDSFSLP